MATGSHHIGAGPIAAYAAVCLAWGTTYLAIKYGVETLPPFLMGCARHSTAGWLMLVLLLMRGHRLPEGREWLAAIIPGLLLLAISNGLVGWAETSMPSNIAAILIVLSPFAMAGLSRLIGDPVPRSTWLGLGISFLGVLLLFYKEVLSILGHEVTRHRDSFELLPVLAILTACVCWSAGSLYSARVKTGITVPMKIACQMIVGGLGQLVMAAVAGEFTALAPPSTKSLLALAYLIVVGSWIGYGCYVYVLEKFSAGAVSTTVYVNTVIAVAAGWLLAGEALSMPMLVGCGVILGGVFVVNRGLAQMRGRQRVETVQGEEG